MPSSSRLRPRAGHDRNGENPVMNVTESRQVARVLRAVFVDYDPASALEMARDLAERTSKVLAQTGFPYVRPHQLTAAAAVAAALRQAAAATEEDGPRCHRCGCTDEQACPG